MKKIFLVLCGLLILLSQSANAEILYHKIYAVSHSNIEFFEKNDILNFYSLDDYEISTNEFIEKNSLITVKIEEVVNPKRGQRNGYLKVKIVSYSVPTKGNETVVKEKENIEGTLRLSTPKDLKEIAKKASVSVVGKVLQIPGFSQAVAFSKGLIKPNPQQNRLQSAGTNLYESTPLKLTKKGKSLSIAEDSIVVLKVKQKEKE